MNNTLLHSPLLIAIEGIDGAGKSTLAQALYDYYTHQNFLVVLTKEPGGSSLGKLLRPILQERTINRCPKAEFLLFAADRAQHFHDIIVPALQKGAIVISDRMADSSLVYQGFGRGLDRETLQKINRWAMDTFQPDITIYLKLSLESALERLKKRKTEVTMFEQDVIFLKNTLHGFNTLYKNRPDVLIIDAEKPLEEIQKTVLRELNQTKTMKRLFQISTKLVS